MADVRLDYSSQRHIDAAAGRMLARVAAAIAQDARRLAPVDTGLLRSSIEAGTPTRNRVRITAATDYAGYVELGTRHMHARPYLAPALYRDRVI